MGHKEQHFAPLIKISVEELVPPDHFYRHLERTLDLSFVCELVQKTYAGDGRPSIDPIVFFKLLGLLKLAKRANLAKDSFPVRLGVALVVLMILNVALASIKHTLPMIPGGVFVGIETLLLIARAVVAVLFGYAIYALREEYGESTITVHEARELQQASEALAAELVRIQQDCQQRLEQQVNLLNAQQTHALATARQELETTIACSLTPERLMARLAGHLETLVQDRLT